MPLPELSAHLQVHPVPIQLYILFQPREVVHQQQRLLQSQLRPNQLQASVTAADHIAQQLPDKFR